MQLAPCRYKEILGAGRRALALCLLVASCGEASAPSAQISPDLSFVPSAYHGPDGGPAGPTSEQSGDTAEISFVNGLDPERLSTKSAPLGWAPSEGPLDEVIPFPWPDRYVAEWGQPFNPWTFKENAAALCIYGREHGPEHVRPISEMLVERMLQYTRTDKGARWVFYDFDYTFRDRVLERGWVSAFGNGVVITGLVALHRCSSVPGLLELARELFAAFAIPGSRLVSDLGDGTLWYEEYPTGDEPPAHVLNGHILALIGMYYLWDATDDPTVFDYLNRGTKAVAVHGPKYRVPGSTNRYDLLEPYIPDYGPARAIFQQDQLCLITGDERFRDLRDRFAEDMPDARTELVLQCAG